MPVFQAGGLQYPTQYAKVPFTPIKEPTPIATPTTPITTLKPAQTPTGLSVLPSQAQAAPTGSLSDFSAAMRAVSKAAYTDRQKKEGKITGGQFDPTKVSGSIFNQIMSNVEAARGKGISKMYGSAVEAAKFDIQQKEERRQADIAQENKKFDIIKQKTELGIDSVYIPGNNPASRNNNPGNLKFVGQYGAVQGEPITNSQGKVVGYWAKFNSPEDGYQALINQIQLDQSRGLTLQQFVVKYAPPTENDTNLYTQQMSQWLGVDPSIKLSDIDIYNLAENVAKKESGTQMVSAQAAGTGVDALAKKYKSGEITASQIPAAMRGKVIAAAETLGQQVSPEQKSVLMSNVQLVDKILEGDQYENISGVMQTGLIPFTQGKQTAKLYNQLKGLVALDKRQMLKGQGAISDFEFKVLGDAASSITRLSSEEDFVKSLIQIRGAFTTAAGVSARVRVSKGGQSKEGELTRDNITDAVAQGYIVEYI